MERADLDNLLRDLIEQRLPDADAERLLRRITSEPDVARAYAEAKLREESAAERGERRQTRRAARLRSRKKAVLARWFRRLTRWGRDVDPR